MAKVDVPITADRGCSFAPSCLRCPWRVCLQAARPEERAELAAAMRVIKRYVAAPDRALTP